MKQTQIGETALLSLTAADERFLHELCVSWNPESVPGFTVPSTLREYLERFPNNIRDYTKVAATQLGFIPIDETSHEDLSQDIILRFLQFANMGFEDIVEMYITAPERTPGQPVSDHFNAYIQFRVTAMVAMLLSD
jgi:hypothetical protein